MGTGLKVPQLPQAEQNLTSQVKLEVRSARVWSLFELNDTVSHLWQRVAQALKERGAVNVWIVKGSNPSSVTRRIHEPLIFDQKNDQKWWGNTGPTTDLVTVLLYLYVRLAEAWTPSPKLKLDDYGEHVANQAAGRPAAPRQAA